MGVNLHLLFTVHFQIMRIFQFYMDVLGEILTTLCDPEKMAAEHVP